MTDTAQDLAADGYPNPPALGTFAHFVQALDAGDFHQKLSEALREINAALNNYVIDHGGEPKAELAIKIKIKLEKGAFRIEATQDAKLPKAPSASAVLWSTSDNRFTPTNPHQREMFGVRSV